MIKNEALEYCADILLFESRSISGICFPYEADFLRDSARKGEDAFFRAAQSIFGRHLTSIILAAAQSAELLCNWNHYTEHSDIDDKYDAEIWLEELHYTCQMMNILERLSEKYLPSIHPAIKKQANRTCSNALHSFKRLLELFNFGNSTPLC